MTTDPQDMYPPGSGWDPLPAPAFAALVLPALPDRAAEQLVRDSDDRLWAYFREVAATA